MNDYREKKHRLPAAAYRGRRTVSFTGSIGYDLREMLCDAAW